MKNNINISKLVNDKIKYLKKDKVYDYSVFKNIPEEKRATFRKAMSRLAKDGEIIKIAPKKFYRRGKRDVLAEDNCLRINADPYNKKLLRSKVISAKYLKSKLHKNLFWSNPNGMIPIETVLYKILDGGSLSDLDFARFNFGDQKVIEVFMNNFDINEKPMIRDILNV